MLGIQFFMNIGAVMIVFKGSSNNLAHFAHIPEHAAAHK
jgi:hypothetical protein